MSLNSTQPVVAVVAALPREVAALVRGVQADRTLLRRGVHMYRVESAVIVAAGMGASRASVAVEAALATAPVRLLISAGLAGACSPDLRAGEVAEATVVIDALTGERFACTAPGRGVTLVTAEAIASVREKARLAAAYGADAVEMEAATVARLARAHGLEFRAIKAISDAHDFELESLARFAGKQGSFRTVAFALHTVLRPREWGKAAQLGRDSQRALTALAERLREALRQG